MSRPSFLVRGRRGRRGAKPPPERRVSRRRSYRAAMRRRAHKRTYLPYLQNRREEEKKKCSGHLLATSSIGGGRRATGHTHSITHLKVNPPLFPCFGLMTLYIRNEEGGGDSFFRAGGEEKTGAKGYHHHHHRGERKEEKESLGRVLFKRTGRVIAEGLCPILKVLVERRPVLSPFFSSTSHVSTTTVFPPPSALLVGFFFLLLSGGQTREKGDEGKTGPVFCVTAAAAAAEWAGAWRKKTQEGKWMGGRGGRARNKFSPHPRFMRV